MARLNSPLAARHFITKVHKACASLRDAPVPVIGRINGFALGAGCEIAAACDLRVAGRNAVFGMPEVCIVSLVPRYMGFGESYDLFLSIHPVVPFLSLIFAC